MRNIVIGIEGEVGSGKTSACRELTKIIENCVFIDGGAIYRGIILAISKAGIDLKNQSFESFDAFEVMKKLNVDFKIENKETVIYINGKKIENSEIETENNSIGVTELASKVNNKAMFEFARKVIEKYSEKYNVVVSARGLVYIYPNMDYHIYITASLDERVKRRYNEYKGQYTYEQIKQTIMNRDLLHKNAGFNKTCDRTIKVDISDCKNAKESAKKILHEMENK